MKRTHSKKGIILGLRPERRSQHITIQSDLYHLIIIPKINAKRIPTGNGRPIAIRNNKIFQFFVCCFHCEFSTNPWIHRIPLFCWPKCIAQLHINNNNRKKKKITRRKRPTENYVSIITMIERSYENERIATRFETGKTVCSVPCTVFVVCILLNNEAMSQYNGVSRYI